MEKKICCSRSPVRKIKASRTFVAECTFDQSLAGTTRQDEFNFDLAEALVYANIPIFSLDNSKFSAFLEKWTDMSVPSGDTIRYNKIKNLYAIKLEQIRKAVGDNDICIMIDETDDRCKRSRVNVILSILNGSRSKPMLFAVEFLDTCDASAIFRVFIKTNTSLYGAEDPPYDRVRLLISDQAAYMPAAGRSIDGICPSLYHVTCFAYCLNLVAGSVCEQHLAADELPSKLTEVLGGSGK